MTAAEIAAKKSMLAALEAARGVTRDTVNAARTALNAAVASDPALLPIVETLTSVVIALNAYRPKLQAEIAATDALVPSDPVVWPPIFTTEPNPVPVQFVQGVAAEWVVSYFVDKGRVAVLGGLPAGVTRTLGYHKVTYQYDGLGPVGTATNEIEAL